MKPFHLTWLVYNKHLYEKLVYMNKKIQYLMSRMIDLLQLSNKYDHNDYSPANDTQLLNRFLTFDEEMSEISCLYKECQKKMSSISRNSSIKNQNQMNIVIKTRKKKVCNTMNSIQRLEEDNVVR